MKTKLFALLLEDIKKDAELLEEFLTEAGFELTLNIVETELDFVSNLENNRYDIIFADFTLPSFNGQEALTIAKNICPNTPFICISGTIGEDKAVELLKQGATDYVLKDRMERLAFATKRALDASNQLKKFRQIELERQTNRKLLQTIINNALDTIFIKDKNGLYLLFNDAAENTFGKTAEEVLGKDDWFIFPNREAEGIRRMDNIVNENNAPITYEESLTAADGKIHIFHTIKCPMPDENGNANGVFGISRDITERKMIEEQLVKAKQKAEENDHLKTAFLHNISHEIRTPMNAIVGFSEFLSEPGLSPDKIEQYSDIIIQSSNQLLSIITDIVNIATIETGQEKVVEQEIDLHETLNNLYRQFLLMAKKKNISLFLNTLLPKNDRFFITDQTKLVQILSNLISNAIKFTKQGSVTICYQVLGSEIEFTVEDTGVGISSEFHEEIFERFRQVESTVVREFGGSGLGLALSKAYVEMLGGKIWLKSELGKGSTFYFTIPFKSSRTLSLFEETEKTNHKIDLKICKSKMLLIVEDEESNFMLMVELLSGLNINIIRAVNGLEAVNACISDKYIDIVLMDIKMPIMDGYEATRQIKILKPELPIIAQTAYSNDVDRNKALESGCNDFISKPIKREILLAVLAKYL